MFIRYILDLWGTKLSSRKSLPAPRRQLKMALSNFSAGILHSPPVVKVRGPVRLSPLLRFEPLCNSMSPLDWIYKVLFYAQITQNYLVWNRYGVCSNLASSGEPPPPLHMTTLTTVHLWNFTVTLAIILTTIRFRNFRTSIMLQMCRPIPLF